MSEYASGTKVPFDAEFLAHLVLEDGRTVAEVQIPKLPAPTNVRSPPGATP